MVSARQHKNGKKLVHGRVRHRSLLQTRLDTAPGWSGSVWGSAQKPFSPVPAPSWHMMSGASQDRSWDGSWATRTSHKCVLERFPNGFARPKLPTIEFLSVFGQFWSLVGSFASCFFRAFYRSFDRTFICSFDLSITRSLFRRFLYVAYIQVPPSEK